MCQQADINSVIGMARAAEQEIISASPSRERAPRAMATRRTSAAFPRRRLREAGSAKPGDGQDHRLHPADRRPGVDGPSPRTRPGAAPAVPAGRLRARRPRPGGGLAARALRRRRRARHRRSLRGGRAPLGVAGSAVSDRRAGGDRRARPVARRQRPVHGGNLLDKAWRGMSDLAGRDLPRPLRATTTAH